MVRKIKLADDTSDDTDVEFEQESKKYNFNQYKYYRAICLMVAGYDRNEIAAKLGINPASLSRWFKEPAFKKGVTIAIGMTYRAAIAELAAHAQVAARKLVEMIEDDITSDVVRLKAVELLFNFISSSQISYESEESKTPKKVKSLATEKIHEQIDFMKSLGTLSALMGRPFESVENTIQGWNDIQNLKILWAELGADIDQFPTEDFKELEE